MGALCRPMAKKRIATSSWVASDNINPFETRFTKKERVCLRETYQRLHDPKVLIGELIVEHLVNASTELKHVFGVERCPQGIYLKMPKLGGHVARITDFFEQTTLMLGHTENVLGAWQLVRKTGRLHTKVPFLVQSQNQLELNYFSIMSETLMRLVPILTGEKSDFSCPNNEEKKKVRFAQNYSTQQIHDVWRRFLTTINAQLTEAFEIERQKGNNVNNQKTLAPHQHVEVAEQKRRQQTEKQNDEATAAAAAAESANGREAEQMFEDPF